MPRPITMVSATLLTAAVSGILPQLGSYFSAPPTPVPSTMATWSLPGGPPSPPTPSSLRPVIQQPSALPAPAPNGVQLARPYDLSKPVPTGLSVPQNASTSPLRLLSVDTSGVVKLQPSAGAYAAYVLISNQSGRKQMVTITVLLQDRRGAELKTAHVLDPPNEGFAVEPFATVVQLVRIQLKDGGNQAGAAGSISHGNIPLFPASGFLRFLATPDYDHEEEKCRPKFATDSCHEQVDPGYLYQSITIPELPLPGSPTVGGIFAAGLVLAAAVAVITGWSLRKRRISLKHRMGSATWSFGQSWGANVASGSALLGTFLTVIAFPDHPRIMDKNSYTILQILFSAIIALAPLIYGLIRRDVQANVNGIAATDSQGYVIMFLLAGGLVLWGALGQLATLGALIREFILSGGLGMLTGAILEALTLLLFILLIIYGLRSLYQTAKHLSADPATAEGVQPRPRVPDGMPLPKPDTVNRPMPEWSLL